MCCKMAQATGKRRGKQVVASDEPASATMFTEEELNDMSELERGPDFIEVKCGCTSKKYGDTIGRLRVCATGHFVITCKCTPNCKEGNITPEAFEQHCAREGVRKWKSNIWVIIKDKKVALWRTVLLKYYKHASNVTICSSSSCRKRKFHRDEFIRCSRCKKERRFRLRDQQECRIYHDALAYKKWKCADRPYDKITCGDEEERGSRKICRGCPFSSTCKGCTACVCFGCLMCRFWSCECRTCVDFMENAEP